MTLKNVLSKSTLALLLILVSVSSCSDDDQPDPIAPTLKTATYNYDFNTGQVASTFAYAGTHSNTLSADILLEEQANGQTRVTLTLNNTMTGETYHIHSHDAADPDTTPNGTPYNETPNGNVFVQQIDGNGGSVSASQMSTETFADLTTTYDGFLVVHDPLQAVSTVDPTTYVILGLFAR
ncbi:MAG: hypothetical protein COA58_03980 [Bacteroidetes bacterium]|nr:MAG: hypothetical protein COA58_03980 [Bacteroidota bacterium]